MNCDNCNDPLLRRVYCSARCRVQAHRKRKNPVTKRYNVTKRNDNVTISNTTTSEHLANKYNSAWCETHNKPMAYCKGKNPS